MGAASEFDDAANTATVAANDCRKFLVELMSNSFPLFFHLITIAKSLKGRKISFRLPGWGHSPSILSLTYRFFSGS